MRSSVMFAVKSDFESLGAKTHWHGPIETIKIALYILLAAYGGPLPLLHEFDGYHPMPYGQKTYAQTR